MSLTSCAPSAGWILGTGTGAPGASPRYPPGPVSYANAERKRMPRGELKQTIPKHGSTYKVIHHKDREQPYTLWKSGKVVYFAATEAEVERFIRNH